MGGPGSGRWCYGGAGGKRVTEGHPAVDIRWLNQKGCLRPGTAGDLTWSTTRGIDATKRTGSISYRMEDDRMILAYRFRVNGGAWQTVNQVIEFDRTPCNYGGHRTWFLCPRCSKRVAILHCVEKLFLCRHCYDLCYSSQLETETDRLMRKQRKIRKRLGASHNLLVPIWLKPKGMHQTTFDRLLWTHLKIDEHKWALISAKVGTLTKSLGRVKDQLGMK